MKKTFRPPFQSLLFSLMASTLAAQAPVITGVTPVSTQVEQFGKYEAAIALTATYTNPYDYDDIRISAVFTGPDGQTRTADGFFMQDYQLNTQTGNLTPVGNGVFKIRFSPDKTGLWKYTLSCTTAGGTGSFAEQTFQCLAPNSLKNKGFIRVNQTNYLQFDNGDQYIPVGENVGWQNGNPYLDYKNWLSKLADNSGNFFRMWQCSWGLGIEWKNGTSGYAGLRRYKQSSAFYQDWLFDFCADNGLYVMLCLHNHGQVSSQVNPEWSDSPYNAVNGGPCPNTWDFFSNTTAKNHVKNRLRYIVARWGYARSVMSWELFNEVDWTDQFEQKKGDVAAWHSEMAAFLKNTDPYNHLVSSSYAHDYNDPNLWNQPDIDFTQTHFYVNTPNVERVLANGVRNYLADFEKPTLTGEFGLGPGGGELSTLDPDGIHIHNSVWGSLFGGGMGAGMSWWWDNYIEPKNLYYHFAPVAAVSQVVPFKTANLSPAAAAVTGVPGDLSLTPTVQGWGALADTSFTIDQNGTVTPSGAGLGSFLYGSQWNTQYRRPPVFYVNFPANGQFRVKTGGQSGQAPKIVIWLDGVKLLEQNAAVNQTYSINVPAGQHTIRVDNTGADWILIANYVFTGIGSAVDAYVLKSENKNRVAGWFLNNRYNHDYVQSSGLPPTANGAFVTVPDVQNGSYLVKYFNCLTGALHAQEAVAVSDGKLSLALPELLWDLAFTADDASVNTTEIADNLDFQVFPNPVTSGPVTVSLPLEKSENVSVTLLDIAGRVLENLFLGDFSGGEKQLQIAENHPAGLYWLKVETAGKVGAKAVVLTR